MVPAGAAANLPEHPDILAAGARLAPLVEAYRAAGARKLAARAAYDRLAPPVPDDLVARRDWYGLGFAEDERDAEGKRVLVAGSLGLKLRKIIQSENLLRAIEEQGEASPVGLLAAALLPAARQHEALVAAARTGAGLDAAIEAEFRAARDLERAAYDIAKQPARTIAGLRIKALALAACTALGTEQSYHASVLIGPSLAETALSVLPATSA